VEGNDPKIFYGDSSRIGAPTFKFVPAPLLDIKVLMPPRGLAENQNQLRIIMQAREADTV